MLNNITVLDFETTGLNAEWDFVTEIGAIRLRDGVEVQRFSSLINFGGQVPQKITEMTGITQEMVDAGMEPKTAFAQLRALIGDSTVVAHNAAFDVAMLNRSYNRYSSTGLTLTNDWLCTKRLAQEVLRKEYDFQELGYFGLASLCRHYSIEQKGHHRALNDALDAEQLLAFLVNDIEGNGELGDPIEYVVPYLTKLLSTPALGQSHAHYYRWIPERKEVANV